MNSLSTTGPPSGLDGWLFALPFRRFLEQLGTLAQMSSQTLRIILRGRIKLDDFIHQLDAVGLASVPVAVVTAIFSSMVMAVQFSVQLDRFGAKEWVGSVVSLSLVRELGPVLTALLVGGRVGSGIAAELASMKVSEQIDALRSMGAEPVAVLVVPRVLATTVALPLLTILADALGVFGAMVITGVTDHVSPRYFLSAVLRSVELSDVMGGLVKTVFFGFLIGVIACNLGISVTGGTQGVGRATTRTVVIASLSILISDFVLTNVLLGFGL